MAYQLAERSTFPHKGLEIQNSIQVKMLFTVHYFLNETSYPLPGETHSFWELVYMDAGHMSVNIENQRMELGPGEMILIPPDCFHYIQHTEELPFSLFIISFHCQSRALKFARRARVFPVNSRMKANISEMIREAQLAFVYPLDRICMEQIQLKESAPFAALECIRLNLELLLIEYKRCSSHEYALAEEGREEKSAPYSLTVIRALDYMRAHLTDETSLKDICLAAHMSATRLQKLFRKEIGTSVMEYFRLMRISGAKYWIRHREKNLGEIAEMFNFSSVHHFSSCFKKAEGQSPREYASSIQAIMDAYKDG